MTTQQSILVAGAGIFGLSAALELRGRGFSVTVVDPGPVPHPLAASNDVSRMIRMDYGDDKLYSDLGAEAIEGWHVWNDWRGRPLYHEDGFLVLTSNPLELPAVERQSYDLLTAAGWPLQRLNSETVAERFPLWNSQHYTDGYFNPRGGWGEAGETVSFLASEVDKAGAEIISGFSVESVIVESGRAVGLRSTDGSEVKADCVVVAAGVWTPRLIPELSDMMTPVAQTLVYLRPTLPERFSPPHFPPWGADIPRTGWYGFPVNAEGVVKLANHGPGRQVDADSPRDADPCRRRVQPAIFGPLGAGAGQCSPRGQPGLLLQRHLGWRFLHHPAPGDRGPGGFHRRQRACLQVHTRAGGHNRGCGGGQAEPLRGQVCLAPSR